MPQGVRRPFLAQMRPVPVGFKLLAQTNRAEVAPVFAIWCKPVAMAVQDGMFGAVEAAGAGLGDAGAAGKKGQARMALR